MSNPPICYDEMHEPDGSVRAAYTGYCEWLEQQDRDWLRRKGIEAESFFRRTGTHATISTAAPTGTRS